MIKNKFLLAIIAVFFINIYINSVSIAADDILLQDRYPNYSYEFTGKEKWEGFNRKMFLFNLWVNKIIVRPLNIAWASVMPKYGMDRIECFYTNLDYPVRLMGNLLQKDFKASKTETQRFLINTTVGVLGLYDPALKKFKIAPKEENMEQVLAYHNVKQGPYLVLPVVAEGNARDIAGQALDLPLTPCAYIVGPVTLVSSGLSLLNLTSYMQPIFKLADNYADPYESSKQMNGIENYIKNKNLNRKNFLEDKNITNSILIDNFQGHNDLKADIELESYNPQSSQTDALRTMLFDSPKPQHSTWSELSLWNKTFNKQLKISSVSIEHNKSRLKYRYVLQKDKSAPVAILYPSIGEGVMSNQSATLARILYDNGYSVIILPSSFNWAFVKSMPENFKPGLPSNDAHYLRVVTSMVINQLQGKYNTKFDSKIIVGTSFGALTGLFVAQQEESDHRLGISNYIFICPPVQMFYALQQIDQYSENWLKDKSDIKENAAVMSEKIIQVSNNNYNIDSDDNNVTLPFSEDEAKLAISYTMRQKLYDLVFTLEHGSVTRKNCIYDMVNQMSFYDYAQKYILPNQNKSIEELDYDSSLYSLKSFLKEDKNYKIYHALDDCFVSKQQLKWLKAKTGNRTVLFSNGSHLGFLYRREFLNEFTKDIQNAKQNNAKYNGI